MGPAAGPKLRRRVTTGELRLLPIEMSEFTKHDPRRHAHESRLLCAKHRARLVMATLAVAFAACGDDAGSQDTDPDAGSTSTASTNPNPTTFPSSSGATTEASGTTGGNGGTAGAMTGAESETGGGTTGTDSGASTSDGSSDSGTTSGTSTDSGDEDGSDSSGGQLGENAWFVPDSLHQFCAPVIDFATQTCPEPHGTYLGQDGDVSINPPTYTETSPGGDDIVTDSVTDLVWTAEISDDLLYDAAVTYCEDLASSQFANISDWRLPTRRELTTIFDHKGWVPSGGPVFPEAFGGNLLPQNSVYWTSTPVVGAMDRHWAGSGNWPWMLSVEDEDTNFDSRRARCVSGTPTPPDVYTVTDGGQTVTHENTGLIWEASVTSTQTWAAALERCANLDHAGETDWRLPTLKELHSFLDETRDASMQGLLPEPYGASGGLLWTSTAGRYADTEVVNISNPSSGHLDPTQSADSLCVRAGHVR